MLRLVFALLALLSLAACGAEPKWAPDAEVAKAHYVHPGPSTVTLYTVLSTRDGRGAHSGLLINGRERIMFDPAGTWHHPRIPERNDVHYGLTPRMVNFYIDYHARETFDVVEQTVEVPLAVAEMIAAKAKAYGAVNKAQCSRAISDILSGVPGFESVGRTWFPAKLMQGFATVPGVKSRTITDDDADDNHGVLLIQTKTVYPH